MQNRLATIIFEGFIAAAAETSKSPEDTAIMLRMIALAEDNVKSFLQTGSFTFNKTTIISAGHPLFLDANDRVKNLAAMDKDTTNV